MLVRIAFTRVIEAAGPDEVKRCGWELPLCSGNNILSLRSSKPAAPLKHGREASRWGKNNLSAAHRSRGSIEACTVLLVLRREIFLSAASSNAAWPH